MSEMNLNEQIDKMENDLNNINKKQKIRCTKNDEFVTAPCECPECIKMKNSQYQEDMNTFGKNIAVVTDEYLTPDVQAMWSGFIFYCPMCNKPSIMVNKDLGKFCSFCGQPVIVRSHVVTNYVRKLQENKRI